ncbi:MAG: amidase family protein [Vulcanimicrobiaceae bacterium]
MRTADPFSAWVVRNEDAAPGAITFGVKDVIDVAGFPTAHGVDYATTHPHVDAWCVALLRAAGMVPIGKTHTTPFALRDPAITRNPRNPTRSPGGSSAGSAAAVAAGDVPFALGTQTGGSVLRPAAYCGVVAFKPTWGRIPTLGVAPSAPSLDTIGIIADSVTTARHAAEALIPLDDLVPPSPRIGFALD